MAGEDLTADAADELVGTFAASLARLRNSPRPIGVALTGGKDSRLIAAGLRAAGAPFTTYIVDYGAANAADVCASAEVARRLGIEHEVRPPAAAAAPGGGTLTVDLLQRVRDTLFLFAVHTLSVLLSNDGLDDPGEGWPVMIDPAAP